MTTNATAGSDGTDTDGPAVAGGRQAGRVAIVTGAASGIGRASVERFVADGGAAVAADLDAEALAWAAADDRIATLAGDVTDEAFNAELVATARDRFGGVDAAVLNAGIPMSGDIETLPMENFDRVMEVNVRAVALGIRACVTPMRERGGGAIAVTASTSGMSGDPNMWPYNTSKAAVINLVRATALDLGRYGIRVNAVAPGPTETGMTTRLMETPDVYEALRRRTALQRWGLASEVAAVVNFLISPDASVVTGALVPADAGISANTGQFLPPELP